MGRSSGSQTTTTEVQYPEWLSNAMQNNVGYANTLADQLGERGYQGYSPQDRFAPINALQQNAISQAQGAAGQWSPMIQRANTAMGDANSLAMQAATSPINHYNATAAQANAAQGYAAYGGPSAMVQWQGAGPAAQVGLTGQSVADAAQTNRGDIRNVQGGSFLQGNLAGYMNPYTQHVTNAALGNLEQQRQVQNLSNADAAAKAKAFGGSRHGVVEAQTNTGFAKQSGELALQAAQANFLNAQQAMQTDMQRDLQAQLANQGVDASVAQGNTANRQQTGLFNAQNAMNYGLNNAQMQNEMARFNASGNLQAQQANQQGVNQANQFNAGLAQEANMLNAQNAQNANMANAQFGQEANLWNAQNAQNLALAQRQFGLDAANTMRQNAMGDQNLASMYQQLGINDINNLMTAGNFLQDYDQGVRDFGYQEFLNEQQFPLDLLGIRYGAISNTPYQPGSSVSQPISRNRTAGFLGGASSGYQMTGNPWGALIGGILGGWG